MSGGLTKDSTIHMWDTETGKKLQVWKGHKDGVMSLQALPSTNYLLSTSMDNTVKVWQPVREQQEGDEMMPCINTYEGHTSFVYGSGILSSRHVVTASQDQSLKLWSLDL